MRSKIGEHDYVDAPEMARLAGLSRSAVLRLARLGRVPHYAVGRRWLFRPDEFMAALRRGAEPDASGSPPTISAAATDAARGGSR